jgi:hypothetical protein
MRLFTTVCLLMAGSAQAALEWEGTVQTLEVHPTQVSAPAVFGFANAGKNTIAITDVRVSCGCLAPKLAQRTYGPGERGELQVDLDLRDRTGKQRKAIVVRTDDGSETTLYVECDIPPAYVPEPKLISWRKDDPSDTKTVRLLNAGSIPIKLLSIASSHAGLPAELKTIRAGFEYEVVVTRGSANARSVIRITTEPPPGQTASKTIKLYAYVQ